MKKLLPLLICGTAFLLMGMFQQVAAQSCTPDTNFTAPGIYPAVLPEICSGSPYNEAVTIILPTDTNLVPFGVVDIDSIVLNNVAGLPTGLSFSCNPVSCAFLGGASGCFSLTGTTTDTGTFLLDLAVTFYANVGGSFPVTVPFILEDTLAVTVFPGIEGTTSISAANCGLSDGSATVSVSAGTAPYTYLWNDGQTAATATGLAAGAYTVTVTDANGCERDFDAVVTSQGGGATIDSVASTLGWAGCAADDLGFITPDITGGTAPLTYAWSNGDSTANIDSLSAGAYILTVTDDLGCVTVQEYAVGAPDDLLLSSGGQAAVLCAGDATGNATVSVSGGVEFYAYAWNTSPMQTTATAENLPAGEYEVIVTDAVGCTDTFDFTITEPDALVVTATSTDETQQGLNDGTAQVSATGGLAPYSFEWDNAATTDSIGDLAPGQYIVTVEDANGCTTSDTVNVAGGTVSIDKDLLFVTDLNIAPNPSKGAFEVKLSLNQPQTVAFYLIDIQGRQVQSYELGNTLEVTQQIQVRQAGIYFLQVVAGQDVLTRKVSSDKIKLCNIYTRIDSIYA
ncbi:MAG: T9SS type A sorting domain-containing protein, partial [Bacteroidota bacterium]